jgi:hypothetical protein
MSLLFLETLLAMHADCGNTDIYYSSLVDICGVRHESTVPTSVLAMLADCGSTDIYYSFLVDIYGVSHEPTHPTTVLTILADCGNTDIYYSFLVDIYGVSHESTVPTTVLTMIADCGNTDIYSLPVDVCGVSYSYEMVANGAAWFQIKPVEGSTENANKKKFRKNCTKLQKCQNVIF